MFGSFIQFRAGLVMSLTSITNEWPRGVTQAASAVEGIDIASTSSDIASTNSDISAEVASVLKPR